MFYRRKILLALLEEAGGKLSKICLQKLLFLLAEQQENPSYAFVPYKFGCFSFRANADLATMEKYGWVKQEDNSCTKTTTEIYYTPATRVAASCAVG